MKYYIIGKMKSRQRGGGLIRLVCYVDIAIAIMKKVCKQFPKEEGRKFWPLHKTKDLSWKKIIVVVVILLSETSQNRIIYMFIVQGKIPSELPQQWSWKEHVSCNSGPNHLLLLSMKTFYVSTIFFYSDISGENILQRNALGSYRAVS